MSLEADKVDTSSHLSYQAGDRSDAESARTAETAVDGRSEEKRNHNGVDLDAPHIPKLYRYEISLADLCATVIVAALPPLAVLAAATWGLLRTTSSPLRRMAEAALYAALVPAAISALQYTLFLVETAFFSKAAHNGQHTFFPRRIRGTWLFRTAKDALVAVLLADCVALYLATWKDSEGQHVVVTVVWALLVQMALSPFLFSFWLTRFTD